MAAKLGSFRKSFAEKRERERFLPSKGSSYLGFPLLEEREEEEGKCFSFRTLSEKLANGYNGFQEFVLKAFQMGKSDPRKVVFSAKMGLALVVVSLLIFLKEPFEYVGRYSVWALLTVVVVFEFSIGT